MSFWHPVAKKGVPGIQDVIGKENKIIGPGVLAGKGTKHIGNTKEKLGNEGIGKGI